jgi:hypothetical protein
MMSVAERSAIADRETHVGATEAKCPYAPAALAVEHHPSPVSLSTHGIFVALVSQPAVIAQAESRLRISRDRSRQKRGPPSLL